MDCILYGFRVDSKSRIHRITKLGGNMKLLKDVWTWVKEWNDWGMKDWIKAGVIVAVVLFILFKMSTGA